MAAGKHLTPKQERFALEYFKTGNASEAYRIAYDAENMAAETIKSKACLLLQQDNIRATVDRLRERAITRALITKDEAIERLVQWADESERDRVPAMKLIARMQGWEAPVHNVLDVVSPFERYVMGKAAGEDQGDEQPAETVADGD